MADSKVISGGVVQKAAEEVNEEFLKGFLRVEQELRAVPEDDLLPINLDIPTIVFMVRGALPQIARFRDQIAGLKDFDSTRVDCLSDFAMALAHTQSSMRAPVGPADEVPKLAAELSEIRDMLFADAMALAKRGFFDEARVAKMRQGSGFKNVTFDVDSLVNLLRERWNDIQGRTGVQQAELDHAAQLAAKLADSAGKRDAQPAATLPAALLRQQAYTVLVNAYDEVRQALAYIRRREKDVESIAPSLWTGRGTRSTPVEPEPKPPTPVVPSAGAAQVPVPATSGVAVPVGLPGSSPLTRS